MDTCIDNAGTGGSIVSKMTVRYLRCVKVIMLTM